MVYQKYNRALQAFLYKMSIKGRYKGVDVINRQF